MSLLPEQQPTQEEKTKLAVQALTAQTNGSLENLKSNVQACWDLFWSSRNATPQQICDALGNNAYKIFQASGATQALIKQLDPSYQGLVAPNDYEINQQDGTVVIGNPIVVETPESENP